MPIEFVQEPTGSSGNSLFRLTMAYDESGRRISKTRWVKNAGSQDWEKELVTHYTGIGTEVRENYAGPAKETKVVVNMPEGLGRYGIEDAKGPDNGSGAGYIPNVKFEWYLKNHLGSTMLVYGTEGNATSDPFTLGTPLAAYDYRAFGEQLTLLPAGDKFTENFTGSRFTRRTLRTACKSIAEPKNLGAKRNERDDEIALNYFGARYLDPMLGMWISMDPKRQFDSPYLYAGNGVNPVNAIDPDGNINVLVVAVAVVAGGIFIDYNCRHGNFTKWWNMLKNEVNTKLKNLVDNVEKVGNAVEKSAEPFNHVTGTEYDAQGVREANKFLYQDLAPDMPNVFMKGAVGNFKGAAKEMLNTMTEEKEYKLQKTNSAPVFEDPDVNNLANGAKNNE